MKSVTLLSRPSVLIPLLPCRYKRALRDFYQKPEGHTYGGARPALTISTLYIAQAKRKYGIIEHKCYDHAQEHGRQTGAMPDKQEKEDCGSAQTVGNDLNNV